MTTETKRQRAERLEQVAATLQEAAMQLLLKKMNDGSATAADIKIAMETADKSGLVLDPSAFPATLKEKLTGKVNPRDFDVGDADTIGAVDTVGGIT